MIVKLRKTMANLLFLISLIKLINPEVVLGVCPICTVAVGAGLGLSRYLGVDDAITGVWTGGIITSLSLWLTNWLMRKEYKILTGLKKNSVIIITLAFCSGIIFIPLYFLGILGHPFDQILGVDKFIFGSILGATGFFISIWVDKQVRKLKGRQLFQYQKVAFPLLFLLLTSLVIYFYEQYFY